MLCACGPCGFLFNNPGAGGGGYRRIPDRYLSDPDFTLTDSQWDELQIPVGMAFFLHNSSQGKMIACYPSPAGATESELELEAWNAGVGAGRLGGRAGARRGGAAGPPGQGWRERHPGKPECLLVPIDACYRLVGLVRLHWRGFDGGPEAWREIDAFFDALRETATPVRPAPAVQAADPAAGANPEV